MKTKRVMIYLVVAVAILSAVSGCHRRFGHENFSERVIERIDDQVEDLNLTAEQNTRYEELKVRLVEDLQKAKTKHTGFRNQFKAKVNDENASLSEITGLVRDKSKEIPASMSLYLDYLEEFYAILDQTQQTELRTEFKKKLNRYWD